MRGVVVFEDGRLAFKRFVYTEDATDSAGDFGGYSTYTFENGETLVAKFAGDWSPAGVKGTYEVVSGSGSFAGATETGIYGTSSFPWEGANLFEGSFTLQLPGT